MNKQNVLYSYNGILFGNKKGRNIDLLQHGWTSGILEASCKRLHTVWFVYIKYQETEIYRKKHITNCLGLVEWKQRFTIGLDTFGSPVGSDCEESACRGDQGSIPRRGNSNPLQYSCLKNCMDRGTWQASPWGHKELDTTERPTLLLKINSGGRGKV